MLTPTQKLGTTNNRLGCGQTETWPPPLQRDATAPWASAARRPCLAQRRPCMTGSRAALGSAPPELPAVHPTGPVVAGPHSSVVSPGLTLQMCLCSSRAGAGPQLHTHHGPSVPACHPAALPGLMAGPMNKTRRLPGHVERRTLAALCTLPRQGNGVRQHVPKHCRAFPPGPMSPLKEFMFLWNLKKKKKKSPLHACSNILTVNNLGSKVTFPGRSTAGEGWCRRCGRPAARAYTQYRAPESLAGGPGGKD